MEQQIKMTSPLFHLTCLPHVRCGFIVFKLIFMWKVVRLLISVYKSRGESTKIWCDTYKNLPSQSGNKVYKWLFPSIHFYCSDASYNFTHFPDPVICEICSLTPGGQTWEMSLSDHSSTFHSSSGHREGPGINDSLQLFCDDNTGRSHSKCKWRQRN